MANLMQEFEAKVLFDAEPVDGTLRAYSKRVFIFAGFFMQAKEIARKKGLAPCDWVYLSNPEQLLGLRGGLYIQCGTWWQNPLNKEIEQMLLECGMHKIDDLDKLCDCKSEENSNG